MRSDNRFTSHETMTGSHLTDDQLLEAYVLGGEDPHLPSCRRCKTRFDEVVRTLEHVREEAISEADQAFTAERLHDQRDRILRRIERRDHPAEVVAFPHRAATHPVSHRLLGPARRWVAAAAAAGLAAGMFLGFALDRRTHYATMGGAMQQPVRTPTVAWQAAAELREEQFLSEIDDALMGSRAVELIAIDAMTTPVEIREASYPR
jgi:hypothetical protein